MTGLRRTGAVNVDVGQGGLIAAQHLVAAGHRRIAILDGVTGARTAMHRAAGYLQGLERGGLPPPVHPPADYAEASDLVAARRLVACGPGPTLSCAPTTCAPME